MRDHYPDIQARGGDVVAIGTGDQRYAAAFVADEHIPFPVLVDDDGDAARAATIRRVSMLRLMGDRRSWAGTRRARAAGHRIHRAGKRVNQLGSTFVVGAGPVVRYAHLDAHSADHAPIDDVVDALPHRARP